MEIPNHAQIPREPGGGPPAIYLERPGRFDLQRHSQIFSPSSIPMPIPNNRHTTEDDVPPPLPPPRFPLGMAPPPAVKHERGLSFDSNGSWESPRQEPERDRQMGYSREAGAQGAFRFPPKDEGYHSLNSTASLVSQDSLPTKLFMSHDQFQNKLNDFDSSLLKKLDSRRRFDNYSPPRQSALSTSASDAISRPGHHPQPQRPQLSLPIRPSHRSLIDSPGRLPDTPFVSFQQYRSPIEPPDSDRSMFARGGRTNSGSIPDDMTVSTNSSVEPHTDDAEFTMEETPASGIRKLHIDDAALRYEYQTAGHKRRACSPPGDDVPMQGFPSSIELLRRREGAARASPTPRLTVIPQGASLSSGSPTARSASYASNISLIGSSISSMNSSYGRRSPSGLSAGGLSPVDICNSPFNNPISLGQSPRAPLSRGLPHQRNVSGEGRTLASPRKVTEVPKSSLNKIQGGFRMCECCPKKPKKFETEEELRAHEAEKQYECSFCGNRFKNKNEAERHQNSLHVRRHSWSCSALLLSGYDRAFHDSTSRPGEADTCGYCGEEFARSGGGIGRALRPTEHDWDERLRHLQEVHKFRECNSSKKFYRADHFRQHLKHSHAGTSGKWTNMLENACMLEEEPPPPPRR
ncbi:hypothetical protein DL769_009424 [Monosporascus sp. CRB-8-3]|nr:hypothetical protein DL769_009424 [Monosporascus sp. CRB-8-3]